MMRNDKYFLSPDGWLIPAVIDHFNTIITHPKKFGFSYSDLIAISDRNDSSSRHNCSVRDEVLYRIFHAGWFRLQCGANDLKISLLELNDSTFPRLRSLLWKAKSEGIGGLLYTDANIVSIEEALSNLSRRFRLSALIPPIDCRTHENGYHITEIAITDYFPTRQ